MNKHIQHFEDFILYNKRDFILKCLDDILIGSAKYNIKWDGSPSVFVGTDPNDGRFFVSTKSYLNKTPVMFKSIEEIKAATDDAVKIKKMAALFNTFKDNPIKTPMQGDLLWYDGLNKEEIGERSYYTFHPNTIKYAIPANRGPFDSLKTYKMGIAWHTRYSNDKVLYGRSAFDDIKVTDYPDILQFFPIEFRYPLDNSILTRVYISKIKETLKVSTIEKYTVKSIKMIQQKINEYYKSEKYKCIDLYTYLIDIGVSEEVSTLYVYLTLLKENIVDEFNTFYIKDKKLEFFVMTHDSKHVRTNHEGYCINYDEEIVKLVDRREFSRINFSDNYINGWKHKYN
jgi:hypothetical protein